MIQQMDGDDVAWFNFANSDKAEYRPRTAGWKVLIDGRWHFGFYSREDAERARRRPPEMRVEFDVDN